MRHTGPARFRIPHVPPPPYYMPFPAIKKKRTGASRTTPQAILLPHHRANARASPHPAAFPLFRLPQARMPATRPTLPPAAIHSHPSPRRKAQGQGHLPTVGRKGKRARLAKIFTLSVQNSTRRALSAPRGDLSFSPMQNKMIGRIAARACHIDHQEYGQINKRKLALRKRRTGMNHKKGHQHGKKHGQHAQPMQETHNESHAAYYLRENSEHKRGMRPNSQGVGKTRRKRIERAPLGKSVRQ